MNGISAQIVQTGHFALPLSFRGDSQLFSDAPVTRKVKVAVWVLPIRLPLCIYRHITKIL